MKNFYTLLFALLSATFVNAQVINVPGDQSSIQAAIETASEGDTVLVEEGLYYENINFLGKAITVGSRFLLDADTTHISRTIIDGSQGLDPDSSSTVIMCSGEDTTSVLMGFTITGGKGSKHTITWGGESWTALCGGGIAIKNSGGLITNNIIEGNTLGPGANFDEIYGGGLMAEVNNNHSLIVRQNTIKHNTVTGEWPAGGGAFLTGGRIIFEGNEVADNNLSATIKSQGAGIFWVDFNHEGVINEVIFRNNLITRNDGGSETGNGIGGGLILNFKIGDEAVEVYNNIISDNSIMGQCGGLYFYVSRANVYNNTFINNQSTIGGNNIGGHGDSEIIMFNNIIQSDVGNDNPEFSLDLSDNSYFILRYNLLKEEIVDDKVDTLLNTYEEPVFEDDFYNLADGSFGVGNGIDLIDTLGFTLIAPLKDYDGNDRPNESADSLVDVGALESPYEGPVGIKPLQKTSFKIYPNPSRNIINIETEFPNHYSIDVTSTNGQVIYSSTMEGNAHQIDLSSFQSGVYIISISSKDFVETRKIIKLRK